MDRFTRWLEAISLRNITARSCADAFLLNWVARFGCPTEILTDRGRQLTSVLWDEFCLLLGSKHLTTTVYRPACNGLVERFNKSLKVALRAQDERTDWYPNLGLVMLGPRSALKEDLSCSTVELTLGTKVRLPGEFFDSPNTEVSEQYISTYGKELSKCMANLVYTRSRHPNNQKTFIHPDLQTCSHVFVRNDAVRAPLQTPYLGPFLVLNRKEKYDVLDIKGRPDSVSINRLKPAYKVNEFMSDSVDDGNSSDADISPEIQTDPDRSSKEPDEMPATEVYARCGRQIRLPRRYQDNAFMYVSTGLHCQEN